MSLHPSRVTSRVAPLLLALPHDAYATFRGSGEGDGLLFLAIVAVAVVYLAIAKVHSKFPNLFPSLVALFMCMVVVGAVAEIPYYMKLIDGYQRRDFIIVGGVILWAFVMYKLL